MRALLFKFKKFKFKSSSQVFSLQEGEGSGLNPEVANQGWEGVGHISLGHD